MVRGHADNILTPFLESSGGSDSRLASHTGGSGCDPLMVLGGNVSRLAGQTIAAVIVIH